VLKQVYDIGGFIEAADGDYQPVRDAIELMELGRPTRRGLIAAPAPP
jgi:hypothetical protein